MQITMAESKLSEKDVNIEKLRGNQNFDNVQNFCAKFKKKNLKITNLPEHSVKAEKKLQNALQIKFTIAPAIT